MKSYLNTLFFILSTLTTIMVYAEESSPLKISKLNGLSNSAILSIYKDINGLMWFGTYDGLNLYDGNDIQIFRTDFSTKKTFDNNIISRIQSMDHSHLWVQSFSGINLLSTTNKAVIDNYSFPNEETIIFSNGKNSSWVYGSYYLYYFNTMTRKFFPILKLKYKKGDLSKSAFVDQTGCLNVVPIDNNKIVTYELNSFSSDPKNTKVEIHENIIHNHKIIEAYCNDDNTLFFIDENMDMFSLNTLNKNKVFIRNVTSLKKEFGDFINITSFHDNILITLRTRGILQLNATKYYKESILYPEIRVFSTFVDTEQDILWIGTDGKGAYKLTNRSSNIKNLIFSNFSNKITGQARGILTDKNGTLWIGTKGDGLIEIPNYNKHTFESRDIRIHHLNNSFEINKYKRNNTFCPIFKIKKMNESEDFWVGTSDSVLYYYSHREKHILPIKGRISTKKIEIHDFYENNGSLWIATMGDGIIHLNISDHEAPEINKYKKYVCYNSNQQEIEEYSCLLNQGDSILWCGSRGYGLVRINLKSYKYKIVSLKAKIKKPLDDILCMCMYDSKTFYVGTTAGLVRINENNGKYNIEYIGCSKGLINDMIHGMLKDSNGLLWLSTNKGIIKLDPISEETHTYYDNIDFKINEFSDDSYCFCPYTKSLFFGGINGVLYIEKKKKTSKDFKAPIIIRSISINGKAVNLNTVYEQKNNTIRIPRSNCNIAIEYSALDYVNHDIEYSYKLEERKDKWSVFTKNNIANFSNLPGGIYNLKIKYKKDITSNASNEASFRIIVRTSWYKNSIAYYFYLVIAILFLISTYIITNKLHYKKECEKKQEIIPDKRQKSILIDMPDNLKIFFNTKITDEDLIFLRRINDIIVHNIKEEDLSTSFIADKLNMSSRSFYRHFKQICNINSSDFVRKYRMEIAAELLRNSNLSIQDVIYSVGIASRSYFYKEFSNTYGMPPKKYREEYKNKNNISECSDFPQNK